MLLRSFQSVVMCMSLVCSFLSLSDISLYECTRVCLSIHLFKDIFVVSIFCLCCSWTWYAPHLLRSFFPELLQFAEYVSCIFLWGLYLFPFLGTVANGIIWGNFLSHNSYFTYNSPFLKVCNSFVFNIFTKLFNCHYNQLWNNRKSLKLQRETLLGSIP